MAISSMSVRESQRSVSQVRLEQALDSLCHTLGELASRLESVLRPPSPVKEIPCATEKDESFAPLFENIVQKAITVEGCVRDISNLMDRLEL